MSDRADLKHSPLHDWHAANGAKFAEFGGWEMPLEYAGGGVVKEHTAVREAVGIFDVSHLGKAVVRGSGAADYVNGTLANDLGKIAPGQAQYTLCCDDPTGGVIDDLIAYLRGADEVLLVPNAANTAEVVRRLQAEAPAGVTVTDQHESYGVLAVQGPRSADVLRAVGLPHEHDYMSFVDAEWQGSQVVVCRTGYTGEQGYELLPAYADAARLWDALLGAGAEHGVQAAGLGARDTLRTEMGYPLHGHELSQEITPVQARAGWAVGWQKPAFWGRDVLSKERADGARRSVRGLEAVDRAIPRPEMTVSRDGAPVGTVTSGTFSPTKKVGIALALLDREVSVGDEVTVDVRGRAARCQVVKPPFVTPATR
ncbi:MAG: glycine cleavage system aminomethyltransferase GcvT [Streptosporangiales bacterium]|nr:glycine cleavage system aminomethyltransferase GcvT [Streptosporangiales bacterium]